MISSIRAEAERQFSPPTVSEAARSNSDKLAAFRAAKHIKDAALKASERQERRKRRVE